MPVGESNWLQDKVPVKFVRFSTGSLLRKSGWYFFTGTYRFHLKTSGLRKLFNEGKAALVIDEETVRELAMQYRGVKEQKKTEHTVDPRVVRLEEYKRQREEAARKTAEQSALQKKRAEMAKRISEHRAKLAEKARRKLERMKKAT